MSDQSDIEEEVADAADGDEAVDDDALAAEWAAMGDDDGADGEDDIDGQSTRVLNQEEIDSLLGFDAGGADDAEQSGIRGYYQ